MIHELPKLPYSQDALEPHLSKRTIEFHHGKHHQAYVTNLNNLIVGNKFENASLETIIREADGGSRGIFLSALCPAGTRLYSDD